MRALSRAQPTLLCTVFSTRFDVLAFFGARKLKHITCTHTNAGERTAELRSNRNACMNTRTTNRESHLASMQSRACNHDVASMQSRLRKVPGDERRYNKPVHVLGVHLGAEKVQSRELLLFRSLVLAHIATNCGGGLVVTDCGGILVSLVAGGGAELSGGGARRVRRRAR